MPKKIITIEDFQNSQPSSATQLRSIVLFGNNVASYKFALARSLLELASENQTQITLEELALPYAAKLCEHLKHSPKQATSATSRFLSACTQFNNGEISLSELNKVTVQLGFNNVLDAFHIVNRKKVEATFFETDKKNKRIILTDELFSLTDDPQFKALDRETESRWNLVETAWSNNISRNLLTVSYDQLQEDFYVDQSLRRKDVTSARGALNGYQKGKCFYCQESISINPHDPNLCDVDHFFPHYLQQYIGDKINLNGVWNLVLSCRDCNRGVQGKSSLIPTTEYLFELYKRNEYLISSHHPLRETLMIQTGLTPESRKNFLKQVDKIAIDFAVQRWKPNKG